MGSNPIRLKSQTKDSKSTVDYSTMSRSSYVESSSTRWTQSTSQMTTDRLHKPWSNTTWKPKLAPNAMQTTVPESLRYIATGAKRSQMRHSIGDQRSVGSTKNRSTTGTLGVATCFNEYCQVPDGWNETHNAFLDFGGHNTPLHVWSKESVRTDQTRLVQAYAIANRKPSSPESSESTVLPQSTLLREGAVRPR